MKKINPFYLLVLAIIAILSSCENCDSCQQQTPVEETPKGALLFWTNDPVCVPLTIELNNGQQSTIGGFYFNSPANCINQYGGYFYLNEGTYTYTIIGGNACGATATGSVTVTGNTCNFKRIL